MESFAAETLARYKKIVLYSLRSHFKPLHIRRSLVSVSALKQKGLTSHVVDDFVLLSGF